MAVRNPQAILSRFQRAGVLCVGASGRTCLSHGLPETPDTLIFSPLNFATGSIGVFLESWDSASVYFVNSLPSALSIYIRIAVEHSIVQ